MAGGRLSAALAWEDLVELALARAVDVVLLAGDVVDQDNRYFEAFGPLGHGVRRLKEAGIAVVGVAGNHDHHTLHEVAAQVGAEHLRVLGRGGRWERWTLRDDTGRARLHVDGWSFPASRHGSDPTAAYDLPLPDPGDDAPVVGLLHCDLDGREPRYAPVPAAALTRLPASLWVLGHVHVPRLLRPTGAAPLLYTGSLLALDPRERGLRGGWLVELRDTASPSFSHLPLSRVRYETVGVALDAAADPESVRGLVASTLQGRLDEVVEEGAGPLELVSCRVRLTGRTSHHVRPDKLMAGIDELELSGEGGVRLAVERVEVDTRPALDLHDVARGSDAPGLLARLLLELEGDEGQVQQPLLECAVRAAETVRRRPSYAGLTVPNDTDSGAAWAVMASDGNHPAPAVGAAAGGIGAVSALRRQAWRLLDELVRQKEAG